MDRVGEENAGTGFAWVAMFGFMYIVSLRGESVLCILKQIAAIENNGYSGNAAWISQSFT